MFEREHPFDSERNLAEVYPLHVTLSITALSSTSTDHQCHSRGGLERNATVRYRDLVGRQEVFEFFVRCYVGLPEKGPFS